jgi:hypothetical protein
MTLCDPLWPYDAFGLIGVTFRELDRKTLIFFERAIPISPNAWYVTRCAMVPGPAHQISHDIGPFSV